MVENTLQEALNDSIDRLAGGETIEDCLRAHPQFADELRTLLTAGQLTTQGHAPNSEVQFARARVWAELQPELSNWDTPQQDNRSNPRLSLLLFAAVLTLTVGIGYWFFRQYQPDTQPAQQSTATITLEPTNTALPTASPQALTLTEVPTSTNTPIPTQEVIVVTATPKPTETPIPTSVTPISQTEAITQAQAIFPNSEISKVELETYDNGNPVWDIEFSDMRSVDVSATTGNVLFFGFEAQDDNIPDTPDNTASSASASQSGTSSSASNIDTNGNASGVNQSNDDSDREDNSSNESNASNNEEDKPDENNFDNDNDDGDEPDDDNDDDDEPDDDDD